MLGQLGNRIQHALRAFTPDDAKALKAAASTYPTSDFYDVEELLTSMGIGEAAVTILSEEGVPTPVVHTRLRAPASRMGPPMTWRRRQGVAAVSKYGTRAEAESAREKLAARLEAAAAGPTTAERTWGQSPDAEGGRPPRRAGAAEGGATPPAGGGADVLGDFLTSREGKALQRKVMRGVFGMLRKRL